MVYAATVGAVDYSTEDGTLRWWVGLNLKIGVLHNTLIAQAQTLGVQRDIGIGTGIASAQNAELLHESLKEAQNWILPWDISSMVSTNNPLTAQVQWYIRYAPHMLED